MNFAGKVALITGASRGIGRAIAVDFAKGGADVVLVGRDRAALDETARACTEAHNAPGARHGTEVHGPTETQDGARSARVHVIVADVASAEAVNGFVAEAVEKFGRVDFAIANAGQSIDSLLLRLKPETIDTMLDVNLKSAFYLCMAVAKPMMKQRGGSIVLMSSIVGLSGNAGQAAYAASKAGLLGLAKSVAKELGSRNIRVNAVAPGLIETAMTEKMPEGAREHLLKQISLGRTGTAEDVSGVVAFLCSDAASYVSGQTIVVDGGIYM